MKRMLPPWFLLLTLIGAPSLAIAADSNSLLNSWLAAQTNIHAWSADFIQTRAFKSLAQPLTATGHVWFAEPDRFRWELGHPPKTIAVRATSEMLVIYPLLKRVEKYPLTGDQTGPWRDALALLQAGFPRSRSELESTYRIVTEVITNGVDEVTLQPKSAAARKMMPHIKIGFDTKDFMLKFTELEFADGSIMRNDFFDPVLNPPMDDSMFAPEIPKDYKVAEPLKSKSR